MDEERFPQLLRAIYEAVDALEAMFPGRHFTPDGHMVGSIGEALAAHHYGVVLSTASSLCHDGACGGRQVQVKATQGNRVAISGEPEHLLVLHLNRDGTFLEHYNGPGHLVWALVSHKPRPKNGQYQVQLSTLRRLMTQVPEDARLPLQINHPLSSPIGRAQRAEVQEPSL
jgi:hypothetical protein